MRSPWTLFVLCCGLLSLANVSRAAVTIDAVDNCIELDFQNAGSVKVEVQRITDQGHDSTTVGTRVLSGTRNCYAADMDRAKRVTLQPGYYHLKVLSGDIVYGNRRCANVLIDANPADVRELYNDPNVGECVSVAAFGLVASSDTTTIQVLRPTKLNLYLTDSRVAGNTGSVTVSVVRAESPW